MPEPTDLDLDGALSADLDDDLPAWCDSAGRELADVRAQLATPEAAARRAALAAARDALAHPVAPPDELTRRRLLAGALADAEPDTTIPHRSTGTSGSDRSRRRWGVLAGVAAAVLLIVGIVALANGGGDNSRTKSGGSSNADAPTGDLGNVGSLDQKGVDALIHSGSGAPPGSGGTGSTRAPTAEGFTQQPGAVPADRVKACAERYAVQGSVRFQASGQFQGRPAVILGIDTDTRTIVFVVAADDCGAVLYSASR